MCKPRIPQSLDSVLRDNPVFRATWEALGPNVAREERLEHCCIALHNATVCQNQLLKGLMSSELGATFQQVLRDMIDGRVAMPEAPAAKFCSCGKLAVPGSSPPLCDEHLGKGI